MNTNKHFLLAVTNGQPALHSIYTNWNIAVTEHEKLEEARRASGQSPRELHYVVRQIDDDQGLVRQALAAVKLTPKQRTALTQLASVLTRPGDKIRPAYEQSRWYGIPSGSRFSGRYQASRSQMPSGGNWNSTGRMDTTDLAQVAKSLVTKGLVTMSGVSYGPKTYRMTDLGRAVAGVQA